jgi:hypothetical protein
MRPLPSFPSTSVPVYYLLIIFSFHIAWSELLKESLSNPVALLLLLLLLLLLVVVLIIC